MKYRRIVMAVIGVIITALSVGALKYAAFGVDPFQSFMSGLDSAVPMEYGTLYVIVNGVLLLFALVFDRHYIGLATFINLFLLGYVVEFTLYVLALVFPLPTVLTRIIMFLLGFVFISLGCSLYITADLGVSTYDAIALVCTNKWKLCKFRYMRAITDFVCISLGIGLFLLGGGNPKEIPTFVGAGTILTAFCMGALIEFFNHKISMPLLEK